MSFYQIFVIFEIKAIVNNFVRVEIYILINDLIDGKLIFFCQSIQINFGDIWHIAKLIDTRLLSDLHLILLCFINRMLSDLITTDWFFDLLLSMLCSIGLMINLFLFLIQHVAKTFNINLIRLIVIF
jgi:hypothetical protein